MTNGKAKTDRRNLLKAKERTNEKGLYSGLHSGL
jgi:hypothetical protein